MTPAEALQVLDRNTDPRVAGTLTRGHYAAIEVALDVLRKALIPPEPPKETPCA